MARVRSEPTARPGEVAEGQAELLRDLDRPNAWELSVAGVPQSYVDLDDATHLDFAYVRLLGDLLDLLAGPAAPLTVLHLGGGACTLPRYVAATRPGSRQVVVEIDPALVALVRDRLGTTGFRLRVGDAREELARLTAATSDVVVGDVFGGARIPEHLTTLEHVQAVRRVLRPGGAYALNVGDGGGLAFARGQVATLRAAFAHVLLAADPGVLRGRRFGNLVLAASDAPLPEEPLRRRGASRAAGPARVLAGDELAAWAGGASVVTDATARPAPVPPPDVFKR